jgi:hypothetical protein
VAAGRLSLSLAVAAPVLIVAAGDALENRWSLAVRLWLLFWGLNRLCVHYDERARSTGMSAVLAEDARAPVVYLRAFENEEEPFDVSPENADSGEVETG